MDSALMIAEEGKRGVARWRRLAAALGTVAMVGASTALTSSPAHADYIQQYCNSYHLWNECISYDSTTGYLAVNAYNGYSVTETEALWITSGGSTLVNQGFVIPSHAWRGASYFKGVTYSFSACAGIGTVQIICGNF